jgi:DNA-binding winged helix-turn-helix (wHTH) protein
MADQVQKPVVRFGVFEANLRSNELRKHGLRLRLPGQPFKILKILLEHPGELVTREELRKNLWPDDTFVDYERSLNSAIKKLREAMGDSAENPRYIETLPRLGYRFIAPVSADMPEAKQEVESATAPDASSSLAPTRAAVHIGGAPKQTSPNERTEGVRRLASKRAWQTRRAIAFGAVLAAVTAVLFSLSTRRTRRSPFAVIRTTRLTSTGQYVKAAISPDGRYISYTLQNSGRESLRARRATTLHDIELVPPAPVQYFAVSFSPDSETVYYVIRTTGTTQSCALYRIPVMGGSTLKLKEGLDSGVAFSPDGKRFAFVRESVGQSSLMVADLDSGAEQRLVSRKLPQVLDYPAWSPDGRIIACTILDSSIVSTTGSDTRILEVRVRDRTERVLSPQTWGFIRQLAWLGDGSGLMMSAAVRGQVSIISGTFPIRTASAAR